MCTVLLSLLNLLYCLRWPGSSGIKKAILPQQFLNSTIDELNRPGRMIKSAGKSSKIRNNQLGRMEGCILYTVLYAKLRKTFDEMRVLFICILKLKLNKSSHFTA